MNFMRDFTQGGLISRMRNMIGDALPKGPRHGTYRNAVMRNEMAFFATLPPTVVYHHVNTWLGVQAKRQAGPMVPMEKIFDQVMNNKEARPHDVIANCLPSPLLSPYYPKR